MIRSIFCCMLVFAGGICSLAADDVKPTDAADRFVLTKVRLLAKPGAEKAMAGARITGSIEGPTTAFVELAKIAQAPAKGAWLEIAIPKGKVYRFVKFESAVGQAAALAEIEFFSPAGKLKGNPFGTSVPQEKSAQSFEKAFDGDAKTCFEALTDNSYAGIDLGNQSQAPMPRFNPAGGSYDKAQSVKLDVWPAGATIRFTTDGSAPTEKSPAFREALPVAENTTIAARAFQAGLADSDVEIVSYRIGLDALSAPQIRSYHIGNSLTGNRSHPGGCFSEN